MKRMYLLNFCCFIFIQFASSYGLPEVPVTGAQNSVSVFAGSPEMGIIVAGGTGRGSAPNQLNEPNNYFFDPAGNLYVAELGNNRIQKFAPGSTSGVTVAGGNGAGSAANQLSSPTDVRMDAAGNLYIMDKLNDRVQKWAPGATSGVTVAGGNGRGTASNQLFLPSGLWIDAAGNLYVCDHNNNRIQKFAPGSATGVTVAGRPDGLWGSAANELFSPEDIFIDASGNMYIADEGNNRIQKWAPGATEGITVAGGNGSGTADNQFNNPEGIFVDPAGVMYISDFFNNRVVKWLPGATSGVTIAGGNGEGPALNQLNGPVNVFVDATGALYVSEAYNDRILKFAGFNALACFPDLTFTAPSCSGRAVIRWDEQLTGFPSTLQIPVQLGQNGGTLTFMGAIGGHGYYRSDIGYTWPVAQDIARYIADASAKGHLATLTSEAENNFIYNKIKGTGYSPWIGLRSTGKTGMFEWVTGEPLGYTKWSPGEPSNAGGTARLVREPYVRLQDAYGSWNDQGGDNNIPFIMEFEAPIIQSRQISGLANGNEQSPGTYEVCYERINYLTQVTDTCCFRIIVNCPQPALTETITGNASATVHTGMVSASSQGLNIVSSPNPSNNYFRLKITSSNQKERVNLQVTDMSGRIVEVKKGIAPDQTIEIGHGLKPGVYLAQVKQGARVVIIKAVKQ